MARTTRVICQHCSQPFRTGRDRLGQSAICPSCGESTVLLDAKSEVDLQELDPEESAAGTRAAEAGDERGDFKSAAAAAVAAADSTSSPWTQKPESQDVESQLDQAAAEAAAVFDEPVKDHLEDDPVDMAERKAARHKRQLNRKRAQTVRSRREGNLSQSNYLVMRLADAFERRFGGVRSKLREHPILAIGVLLVAVVAIVLLANLVLIALASGAGPGRLQR